MAPKAPGAAPPSEASASTDFTGKADQHVPTFSGKQSDYKEFRRRCDIYAAKMKIAKRQNETVFNLVTLMSGQAWDCVEDMTVDDFAKDNAYDLVMARLDRAFQYEAMTELPQDFENYFVKMQRKANQTLQEYQAEYLHIERRLTSVHKIDLPEKIRSWWFLRRSGLTKEQRQLVLTQLGESNLNLDKMMKAMNFIIGQDSKLDNRWARTSSSSYKSAAYAVEEDDEHYGDFDHEDEVFYGDDYEEDAVDWNEDYYEPAYTTEETAENLYDVAEYDDIFASYIEAKSQLNRMRTSRGFYPVVAMVQNPGESSGGPMQPRKGKGKKGKGGKSRKGGKGSNRPPPQKGDARQRGRDALGKELCLRCGQAGHRAKNCPASGDRKRKMEMEESDVKMVENIPTETEIMSAADDQGGDDLAIQDGGAASVLGSYVYIKKYLTHLTNMGVNIGVEVEVYECNKGFRYGNSQKEVTNRCVLVPTYIGGTKRKVLIYVIGGDTRILVGRPLMKKFGMVVDFENDKVLYRGGAWHDIEIGPKGEHTIRLAADIGELRDVDTSETLMPEDFATHVDVFNKISLDEFLSTDVMTIKEEPDSGEPNDYDSRRSVNSSQAPTEEVRTPESENRTTLPSERTRTTRAAGDHGHRRLPRIAEEEVSSEQSGSCCAHVSQNASSSNSERLYDRGANVNKLQPAKLRKMFHDAQLLVKDYDNLVNEARNPPKKEHVVWEVYAGRGRVTEQVNMLNGCRGERFSIKDGWNFDNPKDRKRFIQKLVREEPDDVMISPSCRLWSSLQELTANRSDEARKYLVEARARDHENHLVFVATVYMIQYRAGRHATLEHPWGSRAWNTKALSKLVGYDTYIDQCMLGLELEDIDGVVRPVKKPTGLKTTRKNLYETMGLFACDGQHHHTHLEGYIPGQGKRSKLAEDYPYEMARNLAWCLTRGEDSIDEIKAAEEAAQELAGVDEQREEDQRGAEQETIKANRQLRKEVGGRAVDYVARLHKNLGHPSAKTLIKMLQEVQATSDVVIAAERYVCAQCFNRQKPSQVPPSSGISSTTFNNRVVCDSAWIQLGPDRQCVLTLCDEATRYIAVRILNSEKSTEFIKGVERAWVRHFGVPRYLRVDSAKGWESRAVRDWCSDHGVILGVAPAESHNWLGVVERRHQVVRRALEIYMEDEGEANLTNLKEAAIYVPPRINQMSFVKGFTPTQWVLGRAPAQELSLTAELYNPGIDAMDEQTHFALIQDRRLRAGQAFLRADSDAKLRRAMNQKYYESKDRVLVGQRCWYWRIQGSGHLQKSKWRGPARCVAAELSEDGSKPVVQWLVHGTSLLRCSPAHVRPMVEDTKAFPVVNPRDALEALEEIRARSTTQFRDLAKDMEELDPILEDLVEPDGAPPNPFPLPDDDDDLPERVESDGRSLNFGSDYEPSIAPPAEDEGDGPAVPGIVSMMIPEALRSEERESELQDDVLLVKRLRQLNLLYHNLNMKLQVLKMVRSPRARDQGWKMTWSQRHPMMMMSWWWTISTSWTPRTTAFPKDGYAWEKRSCWMMFGQQQT